MGDLLENGQVLQLNPYVTQMEKISSSLQHLTGICKYSRKDRMEESARNIRDLGEEIQTEICSKCEKQQACEMGQDKRIESLIEELFQIIDEYGAGLGISKRRSIERRCAKSQELIEKVERNLWEIKKNHLWEERVMESKEAALVLAQAMMKAIEETTKEIDASIFRDERVEKRISKQLKRLGIRTLKVMIFVSNRGHFEVHISAKAKTGVCVSTKTISNIVSRALGRKFMPEKKENFVMRESYITLVFVEKPTYQTLYAAEKKTKEGSQISGDNFLIMDIAGGKKCAIISDGMGSGIGAYKQSKIMLELCEHLLEAGVPPVQAVEMLNAILVSESKEVEFTTLDMCIIDEYKGEVDILKAGAATSYLVSPDKCRSFPSSSLPLGVISPLELNLFQHDIKEDCYIIMVSDGVMEGMDEEEKEALIRKQVREMKSKNPKEIGSAILEEALMLQEGVARDDMMILVIGVWELQF